MKNLKKIFSAVLIFAMVMTYVGAYAADETAVDIDFITKEYSIMTDGRLSSTAIGNMATQLKIGGPRTSFIPQNDRAETGKYLRLTAESDTARVYWYANDNVENSIKTADTFVSETSVLMTEGCSVTHQIRSRDPQNEAGTLKDSERNPKNAELFKLENGNISVGGKIVAKYENNKWYQLAAIYNGEKLTVYMNGEKLVSEYALANDYKLTTRELDRVGIETSTTYSALSDKYVAYRYIKIYAADSFDTANYSAALTAKDTAKVTKVTSTSATAEAAEINTVSTNKTNLTELMDDLNVPTGASCALYDKASDGTYMLSEDGAIDTAKKQTLIVTSANKRTLKYYDISYDNGISEAFGMTFEGTDAPTDTTDVLYAYAENYKGNATKALKASLNTTTSSTYPGGYIDATVTLSGTENFLVQGKFALNRSSFNVSFPNNRKLTLFKASGTEIKGTDNSKKLTTDGNEWMSFAVYYDAATKKLATYIDGVLLEETEQTDLGTVTKIRFYFGFTKSIGQGDVYLDDLKVTHGAGVTYDCAGDVVTLAKNSGKEVYIHNHTIYTNAPNTLEADCSVSAGVEGLINTQFDETLVLKNGNSIKTYLVKAIPQYALIENASVNSGKTKVTATVYDFEGTKTTYRLILAEYSDDTLNKVYIGGNGEKTVDFNYTAGNQYVLYAWSDLMGMVPISGAWPLNI